MKLQGAVTVSALQEEVWQIFMDPARLCQVVPGCERIEQVDETHYDALMAVKVQFMTIRSQAHGTLLEMEPPRHLVAELVGEPVAMAGAFRTLLGVDLAAVAGGTSVRYSIELTMFGRLASLGEAIVRSTTRRLAAQFADNVTRLSNHP
jgi:carbon monoxide dehydrogenase subunit G